jgi:hypothetical protein
MAKKIKFESFKFHFFSNCRKMKFEDNKLWHDFIREISLYYMNGQCIVKRDKQMSPVMIIDFKNYIHCLRGDNLIIDNNKSFKFNFVNNDPIKEANNLFVINQIKKLAFISGFKLIRIS